MYLHLCYRRRFSRKIKVKNRCNVREITTQWTEPKGYHFRYATRTIVCGENGVNLRATKRYLEEGKM